MSQVGAIMEAMRASLAAGFPARAVTRRLLDFADRDDKELLEGIYTFVVSGIFGDDIYARYVDFLLVGQVKTVEQQHGEDIEEAELLMVDEILRFQAAASMQIRIPKIIQSRQLENPYGWVNAESRVGPFDFSGEVDLTTVDNFVIFHADWDLAPADGTIDATDDVILEQ